VKNDSTVSELYKQVDEMVTAQEEEFAYWGT
jgi:hypothetical protein